MRFYAALLWSSHPSARHLGAFAMANLCKGEENRRIALSEEHTVPDVVLFQWAKDAEVRELCRSAVANFEKASVRALLHLLEDPIGDAVYTLGAIAAEVVYLSTLPGASQRVQ